MGRVGGVSGCDREVWFSRGACGGLAGPLHRQAAWETLEGNHRIPMRSGFEFLKQNEGFSYVVRARPSRCDCGEWLLVRIGWLEGWSPHPEPLPGIVCVGSRTRLFSYIFV